ncbi:uncharacterized protein MONBRDRAFT_36917 [Monosiga brevicollis MX1]|uniref:6-phosphogluconolactonase n=1 Tax=Monosiga brevicollis TaxID=81824 RepID=A9UYD4_MONBE|nr:uncharacterized protein MONBRDRAFT_36917 [Monosiga brevicollis MX1]EDQ89585.1 predicted protein [Monosiga brevicollis MX1]|eukprot:XP_001745614.1 hypothetical protein [Monosiga brevicollis MX1]
MHPRSSSNKYTADTDDDLSLSSDSEDEEEDDEDDDASEAGSRSTVAPDDEASLIANMTLSLSMTADQLATHLPKAHRGSGSTATKSSNRRRLAEECRLQLTQVLGPGRLAALDQLIEAAARAHDVPHEDDLKHELGHEYSTHAELVNIRVNAEQGVDQCTHIGSGGNDKAGVGQAAAKWLCEQAEAAIADHQSFSVAFSGGSLPSILASGLTDDLVKRCQPDKWQVYFADERLVAHDDDESNYKEVRKTCMAKLNIKPEQVHAIDAGLPVEQAAAAYEADMKASLGSEGRLDVVLLGMGPDGHTCSLFPEHPLLQEQDKLVASISDSPKPPPQRITLTFKALSHAGQVAFITAGDGKSEVLRSVLMDGDCQLPASMVRSATGLPLWFVDKGAAAKL